MPAKNSLFFGNVNISLDSFVTNEKDRKFARPSKKPLLEKLRAAHCRLEGKVRVKVCCLVGLAFGGTAYFQTPNPLDGIIQF
jgi:hypothetical protein